MTRALVIDDDSDIRDFVAFVLQQAGHDVSTAEDGQEGIEILTRETFDLVVVDFFMPRATGAEVIEHLVRTEADTKTVLMSGNHGVASLEPVASAAIFLPKPFTRRSLLAAADALVPAVTA